MIQKTLVLTEREIARLIDWRLMIRVVRAGFVAMARRQVTMPPKIYLALPHNSDFRAMPAYLRLPPACGLKWVNVHPNNQKRGLPTVMAIIVINDPKTGFPLAILDGLLVTKLRTAAASAVAAGSLARSDSKTIGLVGCGGQAEAQVSALARVRSITRVYVWGFLSGEARHFCSRMRERMHRVKFVPVDSVKACVRDADIITTITPSKCPLVKRAWVKPGVHINAIGADAPGKQELDPQILRDGKVVVDERIQAIHGGEINVPIRRGLLRARNIHASLGEILVGRRSSREDHEELTIFDSTGLAIHDVALGAYIVRSARRRRVGHPVGFFRT